MLNKILLEQIPKDLTGINETISRVFVGVKGYEIFLPTLNTIHECARNLVFVNYAIPDGETWNDEGMEILHQMEISCHRDFINAVERFYKQVAFSKETRDYFIEFLVTYKSVCSSFIEDIDGLLANYEPNYKLDFAPSIMQKERFHLLGLMTKILCHLTKTNGK
ncbi:MAG: hypothetical protein WC209_18400 [Ignavibacteriaceae bacterium]